MSAIKKGPGSQYASQLSTRSSFAMVAAMIVDLVGDNAVHPGVRRPMARDASVRAVGHGRERRASLLPAPRAPNSIPLLLVAARNRRRSRCQGADGSTSSGNDMRAMRSCSAPRRQAVQRSRSAKWRDAKIRPSTNSKGHELGDTPEYEPTISKAMRRRLPPARRRRQEMRRPKSDRGGHRSHTARSGPLPRNASTMGEDASSVARSGARSRHSSGAKYGSGFPVSAENSASAASCFRLFLPCPSRAIRKRIVRGSPARAVQRVDRPSESQPGRSGSRPLVMLRLRKSVRRAARRVERPASADSVRCFLQLWFRGIDDQNNVGKRKRKFDLLVAQHVRREREAQSASAQTLSLRMKQNLRFDARSLASVLATEAASD